MAKPARKNVIPIRTRLPRSGAIRAKVDPILKADAEEIFSQLGLDACDAIRLFSKQVTLSNG